MGNSEELEIGNFSVNLLFWGQISEPKWGGLGLGVRKGHSFSRLGESLFDPEVPPQFSLPKSLPFTYFPRAFPLSLLLLVDWEGEREKQKLARNQRKVSRGQRARSTGLWGKLQPNAQVFETENPQKNTSKKNTASACFCQDTSREHTHTQTHTERGKHAGCKLTRGGRGKDTDGPIRNANFY